jgi:hypothetical protein
MALRALVTPRLVHGYPPISVARAIIRIPFAHLQHAAELICGQVGNIDHFVGWHTRTIHQETGLGNAILTRQAHPRKAWRRATQA